MNRDLRSAWESNGAVIPRKLFSVTKLLYLNETASPMRPGQTGFAFVPLGDPVEIEIDNIGFTVARRAFEDATKWGGPA